MRQGMRPMSIPQQDCGAAAAFFGATKYTIIHVITNQGAHGMQTLGIQ